MALIQKPEIKAIGSFVISKPRFQEKFHQYIQYIEKYVPTQDQ